MSTGEQTVENQRRELLAAAERRGWRVVAEFSDEGMSGANGRDKRPGFDRLHRAIIRHQFDVVAAWSVDRLGRSLQDLVGFLGELHGAGVDLYPDRQGVDTSSPAGKALFQMLSVFAEFERSIIQDASPGRARRAPGAAGPLGDKTLGGTGGGCTGLPGGREGHQEDSTSGGNRQCDRCADRGGDASRRGCSRGPIGRAELTRL